MRKKHTPSGPPTPVHTSAIPSTATIGTSNPVNDLAIILLDYHASGSHHDQNRFYASARPIVERIAFKTLKTYAWKGDCFEDAKDIACKVFDRLLQQDAQKNGIFEAGARTPKLLRGYLNSTIYKCTKGHVFIFMNKRRPTVCDDEKALLSVADDRKFDWLTPIEKLSKKLDAARAGDPNLLPPEEGSTSLDLILQLDLQEKVRGGELIKLVPKDGTPQRTRWNHTNTLRKRLRKEIEKEIEM